MARQLAYCKERMVNVDLKQGFHKCIANNQCFTDDPCPLNGKFRGILRQPNQNRAVKPAPAARSLP